MRIVVESFLYIVAEISVEVCIVIGVVVKTRK